MHQGTKIGKEEQEEGGVTEKLKNIVRKEGGSDGGNDEQSEGRSQGWW